MFAARHNGGQHDATRKRAQRLHDSPAIGWFAIQRH
jgi:hypothetical protein